MGQELAHQSEEESCVTDNLECECCGVVADSISKIWDASSQMCNEFPACQTCVTLAGERVTIHTECPAEEFLTRVKDLLQLLSETKEWVRVHI
jgi:hypothetical protein